MANHPAAALVLRAGDRQELACLTRSSSGRAGLEVSLFKKWTPMSTATDFGSREHPQPPETLGPETSDATPPKR